MGEILNQMLENYLVSSNVQLQKGPDSLSFTINSAEGISKTTLFNILPVSYTHLPIKSFEESSKMGQYCTWYSISLLISFSNRAEMSSALNLPLAQIYLVTSGSPHSNSANSISPFCHLEKPIRFVVKKKSFISSIMDLFTPVFLNYRFIALS